MLSVLGAALVATSVSAATIPPAANQWKAECVQSVEGNIPGLKPSTQSFMKYYDYPNRDRFSYPDGKQQVYRFDVVDPRTKFGKAFQFYTNDPKNCCYINLENLPPGEPPPGQPKKMVPIAVNKGSKDLGPMDGGEHWRHNQNFIVFKQDEDWVVDMKTSAILQWNKTVTLEGKTATVISAYTNPQVGNLTDADFAYPAGCTKMCSTEEKAGFYQYAERMN
eukprot:g330.t1